MTFYVKEISSGYNSDSSDSELEPEKSLKSLFPVGPPPPENITETSHSTLFPITKPIDIKDFIKTESPTNDSSELAKPTSSPNNDIIDTKVFQRKRRIGVSLVNQVKRPKETPENEEFTGLGFKKDSQLQEETKEVKPETPYTGFQKGGVMFVKSDVLNPAKEEVQEEKSVKEESNFNAQETEADYTVLKEKLLFLGEGRDPVLPVQAMLIQAEVLDCLQLGYKSTIIFLDTVCCNERRRSKIVLFVQMAERNVCRTGEIRKRSGSRRMAAAMG